MKFIFHLGQYMLLMKKVFSRPERHKIYWRQLLVEIEKLGIDSIGIVVIISVFMGGIITLQLSYNMSNPFLPSYLIGLGNRDTLILEFSSTILSLMLAGKVGSNIATEIGSMRITEQIDSMEIMGINSASFLILPKILAFVIVSPMLFVLSIATGLIGGLITGPMSGAITTADYLNGVTYAFVPYYVTFSGLKTLVFGFLIASVPAYLGYYVDGGALEVGKASTQSVVTTSVLILFFDLILTQIFFK
ncbi:ABC transporter permease [Prolixibacter sp. SD074]|jgi:phospholipid/cholesterol/gamma-HCH transport system permease protein|uniref:MlaE family ABC transporter permease n=1 Tax=Prolixibacter sp. SD074 TaxID=2652391 RepID=UPI00127E0AAC|nr:ABC transporter permease [Prolixibacter sp. SD074]GET30372.1 ABC transporter permease [Prolixibacter sp. SD074]